MESAGWVVELKKQIYRNNWRMAHFDDNKKYEGDTLDDDVESFPYHNAVQSSDGSLAVFLDFSELNTPTYSGYVEDCEELLEVVDLEMDKTDTRIEIEVVRGIESTTVSWLVVEFACHLIYVDIVKYFTVKKNVLTPIPKIAMLQFTRARAKELGQR
ncbi:hypothetical protein PC121_g11831 [Phytophthora cactorum]|nr:hypothetical protein PC121_g11831 [Phytophthora cactorum]